jgi:probable selenium-dependent hydroxylase accessory protein YqeC
LCWPYQHEEAPFFVRGGSASGLRESVSANGSVLVGDHVACGKLTGIPPKLVDSFFRESVARHILVEADGAKGMSFKGYESHEPVVPSSTTHHIAVVGAEILASPISRENTFRLNLLMERWGVRERERISFDKLAEILESPSEYLKGSPSTATRMLLFNKCEILGAQTLCEASGNLSKLLVSFDIMAFVSLRRNIRYELTKLKRL